MRGRVMQHRRVLVIEDDPDHQRLLAAILEPAGYTVTAIDFTLGATVLARRVQPDLILLDLGMPYRSGGALLAELRADPTLAHIPVLVVSAFADCLTAEQRAQAASVIAKPFSPRVLLEAVSVACPQ